MAGRSRPGRAAGRRSVPRGPADPADRTATDLLAASRPVDDRTATGHPAGAPRGPRPYVQRSSSSRPYGDRPPGDRPDDRGQEARPPGGRPYGRPPAADRPDERPYGRPSGYGPPADRATVTGRATAGRPTAGQYGGRPYGDRPVERRPWDDRDRAGRGQAPGDRTFDRPPSARTRERFGQDRPSGGPPFRPRPSGSRPPVPGRFGRPPDRSGPRPAWQPLVAAVAAADVDSPAPVEVALRRRGDRGRPPAGRGGLRRPTRGHAPARRPGAARRPRADRPACHHPAHPRRRGRGWDHHGHQWFRRTPGRGARRGPAPLGHAGRRPGPGQDPRGAATRPRPRPPRGSPERGNAPALGRGLRRPRRPLPVARRGTHQPGRHQDIGRCGGAPPPRAPGRPARRAWSTCTRAACASSAPTAMPR